MPLIILLFVVSNMEIFNVSIDEQQLDEILFIETIATVFNYIHFWGTSTDAWSCGTFSDKGGEQAQLLVLLGMLFFVFYDMYKKGRGKINLYKCVICIVVICSTFSWALTIVFFSAVLYCMLDDFDKKKDNTNGMISIICTVLCSALMMIQLMPDFIRDSLIKLLTDQSFLEYRFYKLMVYKYTFIDIPMDDNIFGIVGNGVGYYCSRAALICSGQYVDFYNKLFTPSISYNTNEYLMHYLSNAHAMGSSDYGSVLARPYSSILSLMGELGLSGVVIFLVWCHSVFKERRVVSKAIIIFWIGVCFFENYFEYSKVILCLLACLIITSKEISNDVANRDKGNCVF